MCDGDIEIRIVRKWHHRQDGGGLREREFRSVETNYGLGVNYEYSWNGMLDYMSRFEMKHKHQRWDTTQRFYKNGCYSDLCRYSSNCEGKVIVYEHTWWKNGCSKEIEFFNKGVFRTPAITYHENGTIRNKIYYKYNTDREKDYALCYWSGPWLPSSADGAILRRAIPISPKEPVQVQAEFPPCPIVQELMKSRSFDLGALEDAVLRDDAVDTL